MRLNNSLAPQIQPPHTKARLEIYFDYKHNTMVILLLFLSRHLMMVNLVVKTIWILILLISSADLDTQLMQL